MDEPTDQLPLPLSHGEVGSSTELSQGNGGGDGCVSPALVSEDGRWQPKKLRGVHLTMLEMHLAGFTNNEIADTLDCTPQRVSIVITSDLGKQFILDRAKGMDEEFFSLYRQVIETVRDGLDAEQDLSIRLTAADKWLKAHGRYAPKKENTDNLTAEDIVRELLRRGNGNISIHDSNVLIKP